MSSFAQHPIANAPEFSQPLLARVHKAYGFVPTLYAPFAESPAVLEGYLALSGSLDKGALSPTERQLVEIAVSTGITARTAWRPTRRSRGCSRHGRKSWRRCALAPPSGTLRSTPSLRSPPRSCASYGSAR